MNLFDSQTLAESCALPDAAAPASPSDAAPLAARLRPRDLDEFVGQKHLVGPDAPLRRAAQADRVPSAIFHGPAGAGKTTLARLLAAYTKAHFEEFSAITGGVADVRRIVESAKTRRRIGQRTLLFVDEIHRFNRAQQDAFLPHVEDGTLILLGATTENPLSALNGPLLSRCRMFAFEPLEEADVLALLRRALADERGLASLGLEADDDALQHLAWGAAGDARLALGALEMAADGARAGRLTLENAQLALGQRVLSYDLRGDAHYDTISAYIKSVRGSDPDAALYWMMRMLEGGEDPMFVARRLVIAASEDVGNADPQALAVAMAALGAVEKIGMPEAAIVLSHATTYLACAPKSNAAYLAMQRAKAAVNAGQTVRVPPHLRSTGLGRKTGDGQGYLYPHDYAENYVAQNYLPPDFEHPAFYEPTENGHEAKIARRMRERKREREREREPGREDGK